MVIYLDSGDLKTIAQYAPTVAGVTTNPSLLRSGGVKNYREFARAVLDVVGGKPVSFEVFADDYDGMYSQAQEIASWGENVYVKIPITDTEGISSGMVIKNLWKYDGIKTNVTAIMTHEQISSLNQFIPRKTPIILSIFAGRIADTGRDPSPTIAYAKMRYPRENVQVLWASTREVYNVKHAEEAGADIITMTPDLIKKMDLFGKDLTEYSRETVQMFYNDAKGLTL